MASDTVPEPVPDQNKSRQLEPVVGGENVPLPDRLNPLELLTATPAVVPDGIPVLQLSIPSERVGALNV